MTSLAEEQKSVQLSPSSHKVAETLLRFRELGIVLALVLVVGAAAIDNPHFLSATNVQQILSGAAIIALLAIGETIVIITRNVDLSIGSVLGLSAYATGILYQHHPHAPLGLVFLFALGIGVVCGVVNGAIVTIARVPSLVVTLGTLYIIRGIDGAWAGGNQVNSSMLPGNFNKIGYGTFLGIPYLAIIAIVAVGIATYAMRSFRTTRDFYAIGSDPEAARLAGIPTGSRVFLAFVLSGGIAGFAGAVWLSLYGSVDAIAGVGYEFQVITAVVVGGVAIFGGSGTVLGAALGALLLNAINSALVVVNVSSFWSSAIAGALLIGAIAFDRLIAVRVAPALRTEGSFVAEIDDYKPGDEAGSKPPRRQAVGSVIRWETLLLVLLACTIAYGSNVSPYFLQSTNLFYICLNVGEVAIMALPLTLIVITGEIDLSVASMLGLTGVFMAELFQHGWPIWPAMIAAVALGMVLGAFNGFLVTRVGLPSLAVTIGTLTLYRGIAQGILPTDTIGGFPAHLTNIGVAPIAGTHIPYSIAFFGVLAAGFAVVLHATPFGRAIFAIGAGQEAAFFAGIRVKRIKFWLYVLSGMLSGFAGVLWTLRFASARYDSGIGLELYVVTIVLLGGISIFGGRGTILGVVLAVAVLGTLQTALTQDLVPAQDQNIVVGGLLLASVIVPNVRDIYRRARTRLRSREARRHRAAAAHAEGP